MKKTMTKVFALFLSLAMCAVMAVPAMAKTSKTSYDFFKSVGASKALQILNDSSCKRYINRNSTNDAVNLDNMLASLDMISKTNSYRSGEGLSALKVTDSMMAIAQVNADYGRTHFGHFSNDYARLDNMAWGQASPASASTSWYNEKYTHEQNEGHYRTMMGRNSGLNSTVTGAGFNSANATFNGKTYNNTYNETFDTNRTGEKAYTVSQYRTRLKNYMNQVGSSTSSKSQSSKPTATSTSDSGNVQMKYTITPVENTNKQSNNGTTRNSNGVYSCTTSTVAHSTTGKSNDYTDYRGTSFNAWPKQDGKVYAYVQEMTNDSMDGFYADIRIFNGTGKTITLQDMPKLNIYSDDGLICSSPSSIWLGFGKTLAPNSQAILLKVRFNNVNANKNFTTGTLRVESTITYTLA